MALHKPPKKVVKVKKRSAADRAERHMSVLSKDIKAITNKCKMQIMVRKSKVRFSHSSNVETDSVTSDENTSVIISLDSKVRKSKSQPQARRMAFSNVPRPQSFPPPGLPTELSPLVGVAKGKHRRNTHLNFRPPHYRSRKYGGGKDRQRRHTIKLKGPEEAT